MFLDGISPYPMQICLHAEIPNPPSKHNLHRLNFASSWFKVGFKLAQVRFKLAPRWGSWGQLGSKFGAVEAISAASWALLRQSRLQIGESSGDLGSKIGVWGHVGFKLKAWSFNAFLGWGGHASDARLEGFAPTNQPIAQGLRPQGLGALHCVPGGTVADMFLYIFYMFYSVFDLFFICFLYGFYMILSGFI